MFKILAIFLCGLFLLWPQVTLAQQSTELSSEQRTIVVAYEDDSPPYMFANAQGEVDGFGIALIKAIAKDRDLKIHFKEAPFHYTRQALEQGSRGIDLHTAMGYSKQRALAVDFGVPYVKDEIALFRRKGSPVPASMAELRGKKVLVLDRAIAHDYLLENVAGAEPVPVARWPEVLSRLAAGEADYAMITRFAGLYLIKQLQLSELRQVPLTDQGLSMWYALVIKKGDRELLGLINEGLTHIQGTGEYDRLYQQWLGVLEPKTLVSAEALRFIAWGVAIIAGLILLILLWTLSLKRQVKLRTQTLQAEIHERQQTEAALRQSKTRFRALFMTAGIGIAIVDQAGRLISANPLLCRMLDYSEAALCQLTLQDITHAEDAALVKTEFENLFDVQGGRCQLESRYCDQQGRTFWGRSTGTVFRTAGDEKSFCVYMVEDISAIKQANEDRERLQQQLQQAEKMEALGQLTGGIAHDFNNILGSILGYTELAQDRCVEDPQGKLARYLGNVRQAGERARDLIAQMMAYSRRETGVPVLFEPEALVDEVMMFLKASLPSRIRIRTELAAQSTSIYMDPVQFHRVLINLCINARDAITGQGEIAILVHNKDVQDQACASCGQRLTGNWVEVAVSDTGSGIDPQMLMQIFDPFFTSKGVGEGTGLGLSVVHGIMHEYLGHVVVESQPGQGTRFSLLLPAGEKAAAIITADNNRQDLRHS